MKKLFYWLINPLIKWAIISPIFIRHFIGPNQYLNNYITLYAWALFLYIIFKGLLLLGVSDDPAKLKNKDIENLKARRSCPRPINFLFSYGHIMIVFSMALIGEWFLFLWNIILIIEMAFMAMWRKKILDKYNAANKESTKRQKKEIDTKAEIEDAEFTEA